MKTIISSSKDHYLIRLSIFLIMVALIAGMAGCDGCGYNPPPSQNLEIRTWYDLDDVRDNLAGDHILMNDLDSTTAGYEELASPTANTGKGWQPIGFYTPHGPISYIGFIGTFNGQGYEIRDLYINRPDEYNVSLFHSLDGGCIANVGVVNVTVAGKNSVGGLVGFNHGTVIDSYSSGKVIGEGRVGILAGNSNRIVSDSYSIGNVTGHTCVGGLVGFNGGIVSNSYSIGIITGDSAVGGLVGYNYYATVSNSHSSAEVTGDEYVGGLVGSNGNPDSNIGEGCTVSESYSTGKVTGNNWVGGLLGYNYQSYVRSSYSSAEVTGDWFVGGLVGKNDNGGIVVGVSNFGVSRAYVSGSVAGYGYVGGLVGQNVYAAVNCSYSTASVTGASYVGGLVGWNYDDGTVNNSFWDTQTSGQATSNGGTGKTTVEMQDIATFSGAGWNIIAVALNETDPTYIWNIVNGVTYPFLSWQP